MKEGRGSVRDFPGKRWLVNLLRAAHLVGVVGIGAEVLAGLPGGHGFAFGLGALVSGLGMLALDAWSRPSYWREYVGLVMMCKLLLFGALLARPSERAALFWLALVLSVLFSHAPAGVRHGLWWRR